jgi:hypothetical protein
LASGSDHKSDEIVPLTFQNSLLQPVKDSRLNKEVFMSAVTHRRRLISAPKLTALMLALAFVLSNIAVQAAAQTYNVLHNFAGSLDGGNPYAGVTVTVPAPPIR